MVDYSRQQAEEILKRAMAREQGDGVSHDDLLAAAAEVGIDPDAVEFAARDLVREDQHGAARAAIVREHRRGLGRQVVTLAFLNVVAVAVDVMTGPGAWAHWVLLGSVVVLGSRAIRAFMPSDRDLRRAEKRLDKRRRQHERRARFAARLSQPAKHGGEPRPSEQFERVVEEGVEALLHAAAERIAAYNHERRGGGPQVRVDARHSDASGEDAGPRGDDGRRRRHRG